MGKALELGSSSRERLGLFPLVWGPGWGGLWEVPGAPWSWAQPGAALGSEAVPTGHIGEQEQLSNCLHHP